MRVCMWAFDCMLRTVINNGNITEMCDGVGSFLSFSAQANVFGIHGGWKEMQIQKPVSNFRLTLAMQTKLRILTNKIPSIHAYKQTHNEQKWLFWRSLCMRAFGIGNKMIFFLSMVEWIEKEIDTMPGEVCEMVFVFYKTSKQPITMTRVCTASVFLQQERKVMFQYVLIHTVPAHDINELMMNRTEKKEEKIWWKYKTSK